MNTPRIVTALSSLALAAGLVVMTTAATDAPSDAPIEHLAPMNAPLLVQDAGGYQGKWKIDGDTLEESFELDGTTISNGTSSLRSGLPADDVLSFGYVAGFADAETGEKYAQLSGQAGSNVIAVRVISASGVSTDAQLSDGVWGAVWLAGDDADEYGAAQIEVSTSTGTTTVSTDTVDVIAADQRSTDHG